MSRRSRFIGLSLLAVSLLALYIGSYFVLSRIGMWEAIGGENNSRIWGFTWIRQNMHVWGPSSDGFDRTFYSHERALRCIYYPLIKLDRLWGNYHILEPDLPDMGG